MKDSILVTGASGFVGTHLVQALSERHERVVTHCGRDGDLSRTELSAQGIRHVYHLAGRTCVPDSWRQPSDFYQVNVVGTVNVLEFCRKSCCSLTLLSSYVYGHPTRLPTPEDHPLTAFNPYGHSKILAEQAAQFYGTAFHVPVTIVRAFNLYGPGQSPRFLIPTLIAQALAPDENVITVEDDRPSRDYIFIADLIDLLTRLGGGTNTGVYNAGTGVSTSVRNVAVLVNQISGTAKPIRSRGHHRQDEVMDTVADISRAGKELNWYPKVTLEEGLRRTIDSMRPAVCVGTEQERVT
jgi:nucleoside-diphosphate-sugar epimerase